MTYNYSSSAGEYSLTGSINASATAVNLNSVTGLPSPPFKVVINPGEVNEEIVKVTGVAGTTLTVVRGWDSSAGVSHDAPAQVRHMMTAEDLRLSRQHEAATSAHGVSGAVVGTSDAQSLTNKNLTSGTNSFPSSLATTASLSSHTGATAAHGATGAIVGTTNTQTLSNKTLNAAVTTGVLSADDVYLGSTTDTTQRAVRIRRLGTDAVSRDARLAIDGSDSLFIPLYRGASQVNSLNLKSDGSSVFQGGLTLGGGLSATTGTFSGTVTATNIPKIASGLVVITIPSGQSNATTVLDVSSYGFSSPPKVIVSTGVSTHFGHAGTVTATSITVGATHRDSVTTGGSVNTYWIAIGS